MTFEIVILTIIVIALCIAAFFVAGMVADSGDHKAILGYWVVNTLVLIVVLTKTWESPINAPAALVILGFGAVGFIFGTHCYLEKNKKPAW